VDPAVCSSPGDDLVVDEQVAEVLRDEPADLLASRARCVGDAHGAAGHVTTLGREPHLVKHEPLANFG
jgi:hypothetical protein